LSHSDDQGAHWSSPQNVGDALTNVDRFNHWMSVDATNGDVNVAFYDTRNDTTGGRFMTDYYLARSANGTSFDPDIRASNQSSNEHDCDGVFPCSAINYGNQQGDYAGVVAYGGLAHPIWVDSRRNRETSPSCTRGLMEEVFTSTIK
jgi:hypothetical protein